MATKPRIRKRTLVMECGYELARWGNIVVLDPCDISGPEEPCCGTRITLKRAQALARILVRKWCPYSTGGDGVELPINGRDIYVSSQDNSPKGIRKLLRFLDLPELQDKVRTE